MKGSRVAAVLSVVFVGAVLPAAARGAGFTYLTTYTGTYTFTQNFLAEIGKPDGSETRQTYRWSTFDYDSVTTHPGHVYTNRRSRYIAARGKYKAVNKQGSTSAAGLQTTTTTCATSSALTPVEHISTGSYLFTVPVRENPAVEVGWQIPDEGTESHDRMAPKFTITGDPGCQLHFGSFLTWTPSEPGGTVFTPLPLTKLMEDAFSGETTINYAAFRHQPWKRDFPDVTVEKSASRPGFRAPSTEQAKVVVDSTVTFDRIDKYKPNKIADLLLSSGFAGQGPANGGPVGSSGDDEQVLVPGLGSGDVSLGVLGQVVGRGAPRAGVSALKSGPLLARAKAKGARIGRMVRLKLVPTAAGRRLAKPHGPLKAIYVLTFHPRGSHKTYRGTRTVRFPARP